jgi:hypothetical protein
MTLANRLFNYFFHRISVSEAIKVNEMGNFDVAQM